YQTERFGFSKGQCDLVLRSDGKWFLLVTVVVPDGAPIPATDFLGVDLGVINIATDSDGGQHTGDDIEKTRARYAERRRVLDTAAAARKRRGRRPQSIRRAKLRQEERERRFRRDVNHRIAKKLVGAIPKSGDEERVGG
ncbi:MAG: transposase, partial [Singulisphaera sp.]|nr:transposase [Singulisphaera sp.]